MSGLLSIGRLCRRHVPLYILIAVLFGVNSLSFAEGLSLKDVLHTVKDNDFQFHFLNLMSHLSSGNEDESRLMSLMVVVWDTVLFELVKFSLG